jgi:hypothetical protein
MIFMVDSGTEHSMVTKPVATLTEHRASIVGATNTKLLGRDLVTNFSPNHIQPGRALQALQ